MEYIPGLLLPLPKTFSWSCFSISSLLLLYIFFRIFLLDTKRRQRIDPRAHQLVVLGNNVLRNIIFSNNDKMMVMIIIVMMMIMALVVAIKHSKKA